MLEKQDVLDAVASAWWEKSPRAVEFVTKHLTREGARIFALEHTYFAANFPRWFGNVIANCPGAPRAAIHHRQHLRRRSARSHH